MTTIAVARHELKSLFRERTFLMLLAVFMTMTLVSAYIGWATHQTILQIYHEAVRYAQSSGIADIPGSSFLDIQPLSILKNMTIYVYLIGSLLGIVLGYSLIIRDRRSGMLKILFSRPLGKRQYLTGKILGALAILGSILFSCFILSVITASILTRQMLATADLASLATFYLFSLVYVFLFALAGIFFSIINTSETLALLLPVLFWLLLTFVLPQLSSALNPTESLNPTNITVSPLRGSFFTTIQKFIRPLSVGEDYKDAAMFFLNASPAGPTLSGFDIALRTLAILGSDAGAWLLCLSSMKYLNTAEEGIDV